MDSRLRGKDELCIEQVNSYLARFETRKELLMSERFFSVAEAIDDDVLIRLPDEFGVQEGHEFEIVKRPNGVVVLKFVQPDAGK